MSMAFGLILLFLGGWLLLDFMDVNLPSLARHWPLFVILGGLGSLVDHFTISRRAGALGFGIFGLGMGAIFYCLSTGCTQLTALGDWGPGIPLVLGLALLGTWLVSSPRDSTQLTLGILGVGLAIAGWGYQFIRLELLWAALLLSLGGFFVWKAFAKRKA
jgi:hypothetical protein